MQEYFDSFSETIRVVVVHTVPVKKSSHRVLFKRYNNCSRSVKKTLKDFFDVVLSIVYLQAF